MSRLEENLEDHWKGRPDPVDGGWGEVPELGSDTAVRGQECCECDEKRWGSGRRVKFTLGCADLEVLVSRPRGGIGSAV